METRGASSWKITGIKLCPTCKAEKTLDSYSVYKIGKRKGHPAGSCKECRNLLHKDRKRKDPSIYERVEWPSKLKRLYGITVDQYESILKSQGGVCAICQSKSSYSRGYKKISPEKTKFSVDHCHATGKVRGLLCSRCNRALGLIGDSIESALRMSEYLKKHLP